MKNIFLDVLDFITTDPRSSRSTTSSGSYTITPKLQYIKHSVTMPAETISGLSVLDLGCCVGGSGAWVLANGASNYVGVEIEDSYCQLARENLQKYFPNKSWTIINQSVNDFLESNTTKYDLIIAFGIIYTSIDLPFVIKQLANITNRRLVIDCILPSDPTKELLEFVDFNMMGNNSQVGRTIKSARASLPFVTTVLDSKNFILETNYTQELSNLLKNEYNNRFCATFVPLTNSKQHHSYEDHYKNNPSWLDGNQWQFNKQVAESFVDHARHHIPGYDRVINKTVDICKIILTPFNDQYRIIDIGCATGQTLKKLSTAGYNNLVGVDSSADMITQAKVNGVDKYAYLVESSTFPTKTGPFDVVICNWTLHFIKNKHDYLVDIYKSLNPNGLLILSDKTSTDLLDIKLYHDFKKTQGVTYEEVVAKADSVKDIMFIDSPTWYLETLKSIGFDSVSIIDADYCFTSFMAVKNRD